ncbi:MAG: hypothetical protein CL681_28395 [Blastopirellula sp.]|nr:hypothetical protein [Blastopirellula sp.]MAR13881.1 hypothetical protein [Blastopirellula sp.]
MRSGCLLLIFVSGIHLASTSQAADLTPLVEQALAAAGENRGELEAALAQVPASQRPGMRFLIAHMPPRDVTSLKAKFLLENVRLAYAARQQAPWKDQVSDEIFFNYVLPYANINERRDAWRKDFHERFHVLVEDAKTPSEAAAILNREVFRRLSVKYSTKRAKADQSPYESIKSGLASCTGLAVILVDACRAVGVPARFVGTPLWSDQSGNHSWVEVWDDGWHFTGAAEPTGNELDRAWFTRRAAAAQRDHPLHAIYAVSFRRTPQRFPFVWDRRIDYVSAVNVTDRYTEKKKPLPDGNVYVMLRVLDQPQGERQAAAIRVLDGEKVVLVGKTKDERFDANDHLTAVLPQNSSFLLEVTVADQVRRQVIRTPQEEQLVTVSLAPGPGKRRQTQALPRQPDQLVDAKQIPRLDAVRARGAIQVDGKLDEVSWQKAPKSKRFVDLIRGGKTLHNTQASVVWDDEYLYVGFWVEEPLVRAKYTKRDDPIYYDNDVELFIAGKDAYYEFEINPHGTIYEGFFIWEDAYQRDGYDQVPGFRRSDPKVQVFDGVGFRKHPRGKRIGCIGWDFPRLKSAVHIDGTLNDDSDRDRGWTVELAFPWQEMKWLAKGDGRSLPPRTGDVWRMDLFRFNPYLTAAPDRDSGGWAVGRHAVWDSHIPEIFPYITFQDGRATSQGDGKK